MFGLWVEPEMVSPDSELYRAASGLVPACAGPAADGDAEPARAGFVARRRVRCRGDMIAGVLRSAPISYVKWDMNRNMTEIGSAALPPERQRETAHRYMLGLYRVLERLTREFPHVLFESCASGGGRFDPGMLYYMPQTWTSDNTDAVTPPEDPVRHEPRLSGRQHGRPCVRRAQPSGGPRHAAGHARACGHVRQLRLRAGRDRPDGRRKRHGCGSRSRCTRKSGISSSSAICTGCSARSKATRRPGCT